MAHHNCFGLSIVQYVFFSEDILIFMAIVDAIRSSLAQFWWSQWITIMISFKHNFSVEPDDRLEYIKELHVLIMIVKAISSETQTIGESQMQTQAWSTKD